MISPKKIHQWIVKALEEPYLRAEMHRVEMSLPDHKKPQLRLVEGSNNEDAEKSVQYDGMGSYATRS